MTTVTTYQMAHIPGEQTLCAGCAETVRGLGPVSHGAHSGDCDECGVQRDYPSDAEQRYALPDYMRRS